MLLSHWFRLPESSGARARLWPAWGCFIALLQLGCGDGDPPKVRCAPEGADRVGSYLVTLSEREGGTCGALDPGLFDRANPRLDNDCTLDEQTWQGCTLERRFECTFIETDTILNVTETTTQVSDDGARIEGTAERRTRSIRSGETTCLSSYDWLALRQ